MQGTVAVQYRSLESLRFDPGNPGTHSKRQIRQIARSLQTLGFFVPALIDARGQLTAGHGRALAARFLGLTEIPTLALEHLTEPQKRAFLIADNWLTGPASKPVALVADAILDCRRWQAFTGQAAALESTGVSFNEMEGDKNVSGT